MKNKNNRFKYLIGLAVAMVALASWIASPSYSSSRLTASAFAVDLIVNNIEVTQAMQTTTNTIQLVAQRSTAVRVTIGVTGAAAPVAGVTGTLRVFVDGTEITPAAGVAPINAPFTAPLAPNRANENDTLNFELPAPTGITASANVDFQVTITPIPGEADTTNNSGAADDLNFADRATPLLFFTRINYTPAGLGLSALADVQAGIGDSFVRGILPVDDSDVNLYQQGLFPTLNYSGDANGDGMLDALGSDGDDLLSLLEACRQLIVDSGVGASDRIFLYGWLAGNPIIGNGLAGVGGRVAFGNTQLTRHQRSYAHELTHNFGYNTAHSGCAPLDEVGWDVGARLPGNPAGNNTMGRVKPTTLSDIQCGGLLTNQAWIKTGDGGDTQGYNGLLNHPTLAAAGGDFSTRAMVIRGIINQTGTTIVRLEPVFRYPWLSRPTQRIRPPNTPGFQVQQQTSRFLAVVTAANGNVITVPFNAGVHDDGEGGGRTGFGFFSVMVPLAGEVASVRITDNTGQTTFGELVRSQAAPSIQIVSPQPGSSLGQSTRVVWQVQDPDTNPNELRFQVAYSPDNGQSFVPLGVDLKENELTFDSTQIRRSLGNGLIRVFVSDGLNTSFVDVANLRFDVKCHTMCFRSPQYYLLNLNRLPKTSVLIGGNHLNAPVSTENVSAIRLALQGGATPLQRLNQEFVAAQLSVGNIGPAAEANVMWSQLSCFSQGLANFAPIGLSNGAELGPNSMLKDLFMQARLAAQNPRTSAADLIAIVRLFDLLNGDGPSARCGPPPAPDLTPEPRTGSDGRPVPGPNGFCRRDAAGNLVVRVRNLGGGFAGPSVTRVVFETSSGIVTRTVLTEGIPPFGFKDVVFPIPPGSFIPDCNFTITVDSGLTVTESNEGNNIKIGICIG